MKRRNLHWNVRRFALAAALCALTCAILFLIALVRFQPLLGRLAVARASNTVNRIVTEAVNEAIANGEIRYERFIRFEKDDGGRIAALYSDMAACSRLQSEILRRILARMEDVPARELSIPLGTVLGPSLLAGRGPRIRVRMEAAGSSCARFENTFVSAGINQTKHQMILHIDVNIAILLPGFTTATQVSNAVTVAETVIVGTVPETYTYFSTNPADGFDDPKDYVMNQG